MRFKDAIRVRGSLRTLFTKRSYDHSVAIDAAYICCERDVFVFAHCGVIQYVGGRAETQRCGSKNDLTFT